MKMGITGEQEEHFLKGVELAVFITGEDGKEYLAMDRRLKELGAKIEGEVENEGNNGYRYNTTEEMISDLDLQTLVKKFKIPTCPDVAKCQPENYRNNLALLDQIEEMVGSEFRCKPFQRRDLARGALHDGLILAWEQGCGKNLGGILWSLLKVGLHPQANGKLIPNKPCLIVAPENLWDQAELDYQQLFGKAWPGVTRLEDQETFLRLGKVKPGWYFSSFTKIALNKVKSIPEVPQMNGVPDEKLSDLMNFFGIRVKDASNHRLLKRTTTNQQNGESQVSFYRYKETDVPPWGKPGVEDASIHEKALDLCADKRKVLAAGVGEEVNGIRCVFSPSLADLVRHAFECVIIDEAVRIKAEDSIIGIGVRSLCPKYRGVLTGTPVKNRLPDIFFLAAWACDALDEANARWPYTAHEDGEAERFAVDFLIMSRNISKERREAEADGRAYTPPSKAYRRKDKQRRGKPTAEVCNIHRLWKLLAPVVLRRRKADIGEDIVAKIRHPIMVPMGKEQAQVTKYHLEATYLDKNKQPAIGAKLQALRACAAAPHNTDSLHNKGPNDDQPYIYVSKNPFIPRTLAALRIVEEVLLRREQVVIASAFHEANDHLSRLLTQAGIPHDLLDGRMSPEKRGKLSTQFKKGLPFAKPVLLAGNKACAEGYSWNLCNNLIQYNFDWALDLALQISERVHRLNSVKDVNIYPIMAKGTIDAKLESMIREKTDSAELVLDGKLIGESVEEVNLFQLLQIAQQEFTTDGTIDERDVEAQWPALCARLNAAYTSLIAAPPVIAPQQKKASEIVVEALQSPMRKIIFDFGSLPSFGGATAFA